MLNRSLVLILIVASSFVLATGQIPDAKGQDADKTAKASGGTGNQKVRDLAFASGVDLMFLIKELAREMDLNVLFDPETFRTPGRKTFFELKNVTAAQALDFVLLQESLYFEEVGPRTILIAHIARQQGIPQIGVRTLWMSEQLAQYFGVGGGILVNAVRDNSPAAKAGLRAGDVIVEIDGAPIQGTLSIVRAMDAKSGSDVILRVVRNRKTQWVTLTPSKGIESVQ